MTSLACWLDLVASCYLISVVLVLVLLGLALLLVCVTMAVHGVEYCSSGDGRPQLWSPWA